MMRSALFLLLTCFFASFASAAIDREALAAAYQRGNQEAANDNFEAAIAAYEEALAIGQSANVHYNLANAHAQLEHWGPAVLHYHKALALDPQLVDARANLLLTLERAELEAPPSNFWRRWAEQLPLTLWAIALVLSVWGLLSIWVLFGKRLRAPRIKVILTLLCLALAGAAFPALYGYHLAGHEGVVVAESAELRVAPTAQSPAEETLPGGTVARALRATQGYLLVETTDGLQGYLTPEEFVLIWDPK